jgi:hypothetical protein
VAKDNKKKNGQLFGGELYKRKEETKIQGVGLGNINHAGSWAAVDVKKGEIKIRDKDASVPF